MAIVLTIVALGLTLFVGGWCFLFLHYFKQYEKNHPDEN